MVFRKFMKLKCMTYCPLSKYYSGKGYHIVLIFVCLLVCLLVLACLEDESKQRVFHLWMWTVQFADCLICIDFIYFHLTGTPWSCHLSFFYNLSDIGTVLIIHMDNLPRICQK